VGVAGPVKVSRDKAISGGGREHQESRNDLVGRPAETQNALLAKLGIGMREVNFEIERNVSSRKSPLVIRCIKAK
jgi:hypothetical protein